MGVALAGALGPAGAFPCAPLAALFVLLFTPGAGQAFRRQVLDGVSASAAAAELGMTVNAVLIAKSRVLQRFRQEAAGLLD